jgi:hypothetical protein
MNNKDNGTIDLTPSPRLLRMLGEIELSHWQCIAELCDNSFDNFTAIEQIDNEFVGRVEIELPTAERPTLLIRDNGSGMDFQSLERALRAGYSSQNNVDSLGLFGMGFNIAVARLGYRTQVRTTQLGDESWLQVTIDFRELDKNNSFLAPVTQPSKDAPSIHGTEIEIFIKPDLLNEFKAQRFKNHLSESLGRTYSYLIRTAVPGLRGDASGRGRNFELRINDDVVSPILPCIWSDERFVDRAESICAVQYIDFPLKTMAVCLSCGLWSHPDDDEATKCSQCESPEISMRERRVWGWIGIQRYLDDQEFGIDFLRNGRKILTFDKSIFTYEDPDLGTTRTEYPSDVPANKGRIVGEIHIDHVKVTYQKNNFFRDTRDWKNACELIRGNTPFSSGRSSANSSQLALLFRTFRRNDTGLKYLIAGSGGRADNSAAREWGDRFRKGLPEYITDEKWYEEASAFTNKSTPSPNPSLPPATDDPVSIVFGPGSHDGGQQPTNEESPGENPITRPVDNSGDHIDTRPETIEERFTRYKEIAKEIYFLNISPSLSTIGTVKLRVWVDYQTQPKVGSKPIESRYIDGKSIEEIVFAKHRLFSDFGFEIETAAIQEFAVLISQNVIGERPSLSSLIAELMQTLPELRQSDFVIRERAQMILKNTSLRVSQIAQNHPAAVFEALSTRSKERTQRRTAQHNQGESWENLLIKGTFCEYLDGQAISDIISNDPESYFDNALLRVAFRSWSTNSVLQNLLVEKWSERFASVQRFIDEPECSQDELKIATITLRTIETVLVEEN